MKAPKKITVIENYSTEDPECRGDYAEITVLFDGKVVREYGDYYHDKGDVRAEEFIAGVLFALRSNVKVETVKTATWGS